MNEESLSIDDVEMLIDRENEIPWFWQLPKHRFNRRAHWHDYTSPCFYMITISRNEQFAEPFSIIEDKVPDGKIVPDVTLTRVGKIILRELIRIEAQYPDVHVRRWVIMPDHLHFVLWVKHRFPMGLGRAVGYFKSNATGMFRKKDVGFASREISLFAESFHDRILTRRGMLESLFNYVETNPLRLLMRRANRDNFKRRRLRIGCLRYSAYGNLSLLSDPWRLTLRWSSRYKAGEWEELLKKGEEVARCGGVLISPFINPKEKEAMKSLMLKGARVIKLTEYSIGERWHAKGEDFALCSQGRLLLLGKEEEGISPHVITRAEAMDLNTEARLIADSLRRCDYQLR